MLPDSWTAIMVCDQPYLTSTLLNELLTENNEIVGCTYNGIIGTPVLFHEKYFPELLKLQGENGAKVLLRKYLSVVRTIPFMNGHKTTKH